MRTPTESALDYQFYCDECDQSFALSIGVEADDDVELAHTAADGNLHTLRRVTKQ